MATKTPHPHSWSVKCWPDHVYPSSPANARYLVRANKDSLILEGALVRVGRELVIIGDRYVRWMQKKGSAVPGYECPANKGKAAA